MEKQWLKQLQHEKSLRLELQENFEALAKQMHSFERQARKVSLETSSIDEDPQEEGDLENSQQFPLPSSSLKPLSLLKTSEESPKVPGGAQRVTQTPKKGVTFDLPKPSPSPPPFSPYPHPFDAVDDRVGGEDEEEDDDEDDKFFDAPEADEHLAPPTNRSLGHKRTPSSISVNEATPIPPSALPENLPASTSQNRIQVSARNLFDGFWVGFIHTCTGVL